MLKTSDYCKYLPHDLQVQFEGIDCYLYGLQVNNICLLNTCDNYSSIDDNMPYVLRTKPYLRPISQMAEEITHNGKTSIPIIELAKIAGYKDTFAVHYLDNDRIWVDLDKDGEVSFFYYFGTFRCIKGFESIASLNQQIFFEWCYEHHFWLGDQSYFDKGLILNLKN